MTLSSILGQGTWSKGTMHLDEAAVRRLVGGVLTAAQVGGEDLDVPDSIANLGAEGEGSWFLRLGSGETIEPLRHWLNDRTRPLGSDTVTDLRRDYSSSRVLVRNRRSCIHWLQLAMLFRSVATGAWPRLVGDGLEKIAVAHVEVPVTYPPGTVLYDGTVVGTAEDGLTRIAKKLLLEDARETRRGSHAAVERRGEITAYLNAILALRAQSDFYADTTSGLRSELLAEARREEQESAATAAR